MTTEELSALKTKAKLTLRLHTESFDTEIEDLIKACVKEAIDRKAIREDQMGDPRVIRMIMTYVRAYFGEPENPERLIASYKEQCSELMQTTNYTEWRC